MMIRAGVIRDKNRISTGIVALAETLNDQEASETLYISQPVLSTHIQRPEKGVGAFLFDRTTRKVRLSKEGQLFRIIQTNESLMA